MSTLAARAPDIEFHRQPLRYLDRQLETAAETFWITPSTLCVADSDAAKAVLANPNGLFLENSAFFHTRRGPFGPRSVQLELARSARQLLSAHAAARRASLTDTIEAVLGRSSDWPDTGDRLMYRYFAPVLRAPERAGALDPRLR